MRRSFLKALSAHLPLLLGLGSLPQGAVGASRKSFKIFMLLGREESSNELAFREYLSYQGLDIQYTVRNTAGDAAKIAAAVAEIKAARPDLIYAWGTPQALGVSGALSDPNPSRFIRDIPIVFTYVGDPLGAKIVKSLEKPGGNVTGTVHVAPIVTQVNTILAYRKITKIGVIYNPAEKNSLAAVATLRQEWISRGLQLVDVPVPLRDGKPVADSIPQLIADCKAQGAEMLYIGPDTFIATTNRDLVADTALKVGLPTFSVTELIVRSGGALFALSSSAYGIGRLTAAKAAAILINQTPPGDIPVETLRRFSIVINMGTAKSLSYYPPISLLNYAEVINT